MKYAIGVIDYGIGGIHLSQRIKELTPEASILYFSDSGFTPYGMVPKERLRHRIEKVLGFMFDNEVNHVVVACHSASSIITSTDIGVSSITESTLKSVINSNIQSIGILGGGRTIRSGKYKNALEKVGINVKQRIAQQFSILIEGGTTAGMEVDAAIRKIVGPLKNQEGLLLACTHYPAIKKQIRSYIGQDKIIIDPIEELLNGIRDKLDPSCSNSDKFFTTGDSSLMINAASKAFGYQINDVKKVFLD